MKRIVLFLVLTILVSSQQMTIQSTCTCKQIFTEVECKMNSGCAWTATTKICDTSNTVSPQETYATYCDSFTTQANCAASNPCAWLGSTCSYFTACSAFLYETEEKCQALSTRCISDGARCVEKDACSTYTTQKSCSVNLKGKLCYWDISDNVNQKCVDPLDCSQLPATLTTDTQCRDQIQKCTAKQGGGCVESETDCKDQKSEVGCVWNKSQTQACFWSGTCLDKTCDNALISNTTDLQCIQYLSTCTTKQGGGCVTRSSCSAATNQAACVTDNQGKTCFWNGNKCVDKTCQNGLSTFTTNKNCQDYLSSCITTGSGCVDNTGCSAAKVVTACDKALTGDLCVWDSTQMSCKPKTCDNAGSKYVGHDQCTAYMSTCTAKPNSASGCTDRTCINAPLTINTNDLCKSYSPNDNCITKNGGGCRINTTCADIDINIACDKDVNGNLCIFDTTCKQKTCDNSPTQNDTHALCSLYLPQCTVNSNNKCVNKTCEAIISPDNCTKDMNNKPCISKKCYMKQCAFAPKTITTQSECQTYLNGCLLDYSGAGCMNVPTLCSQISNADSCIKRADGGLCGMQGNNCVDKSCLTAPSTTNTMDLCKTYLEGCVLNSTNDGCVSLSSTCKDRSYNKDVCEIEQAQTLTPKCQYNTTNSLCFDIKCENATIESFKDGVTQDKCWGYFSLNCVINATGNQCSTRPITCNRLPMNACQQTKVLVGDKSCYWNSSNNNCVDNVCKNIVGTDHNTCNTDNPCTVNKDNNGCIDLQASCTSYTTSEQCEIDSQNVQCVWSSTKCGYPLCSAAPQTPSYNTDEACSNYFSKCTVTPYFCGLKSTNCSDYTLKAQCDTGTIDGKNCQWNAESSTCGDFTGDFDCTTIIGIGLTYQYCQHMDKSCSVNKAGTSCIQNQTTCASYSVDDCFYSTQQLNCYRVGIYCKKRSSSACRLGNGDLASCQALKDGNVCTKIDGNSTCTPQCQNVQAPYTWDRCGSYDYLCVPNVQATACYVVKDTCANTDLVNCVKSLEGGCYVSGGQCKVVKVGDCTKVTGKGLSFEYCDDISDGSCVNSYDQTTCVESKNACADITDLKECTTSASESYCTLNQAGTACEELTVSATMCSQIKVHQVTTYTNEICSRIYSGCFAKADSTGCRSFQCSDFSGPYSKYSCLGYGCNFNQTLNKCIDIMNQCSDYEVNLCAPAFEGECNVVNNQCVLKSCDITTATQASDCTAHSSNCTLNSGGCQNKSTCASYIQTQCHSSLDGKDCLWNKTTKACVDKKCANAEQTANYNTHELCQAVGACTVRQTGAGCQDLSACSLYKTIGQCKININNAYCVWNTNVTPAVCSDKTCDTASLSLVSHSDCQGFLTTCTVQAIANDDGTFTPKGCTPLAQCSSYKSKEQCQISSEQVNGTNIKCGWNGTVCANFSCTTADQDQNTPTLCATYLAGCTVNSTDNGCIAIPDKCEGQSEHQCYDGSKDSQSRFCFWDPITTSCITKTCENAPVQTTADDCNTYLTGCTRDDSLCKTKVCEDFLLATDDLCKVAMSTCTSNGINCVTRSTCSQAQSEIACNYDVNNKPCQWMSGAKPYPYCIDRTCATAPSTLTTEQQCVQYFKPASGSCTTKKDGGCVLKGACQASQVQASCTTDSFGKDCQWDTQARSCRLKECKDFKGNTHADCQKIRNMCTAGLNGYCATMTTCLNTTVRAACIVGTDGPCLWIKGYQNNDNSLGACFLYSSCKSLNWTSDTQCKLISSNCTTDGTECLGITSCDRTNLNGGCKTGTDGQCIQTVKTKGGSDQVCKLYSSCDVAYYLTHEECYNANPNCTSDYTNGCVSLAACSTYTQNQCKINKDGPKYDSNKLKTSTGNCTWDETNKTCRDEQCTDIKLMNASDCQNSLSTCTSDGTTCIVKGKCSTYTTDGACNNGGGTEGTCFWVAPVNTTPGSCRTKLCSDIQNGTTTLVCQNVSNCVSDGTNCIQKSTCSTYKTKLSCNSQGSDGICVWTETVNNGQTTSKCTLMTNCQSAGADSNACTLTKDRCQFKDSKSCQDHTCDSYATQTNKCQQFHTWDLKKYNICQLIDNKCLSTDASGLSQANCYVQSAYQYSWNPTSNKCSQCGSTVNPNSTVNNTNDTSTVQGMILGFAFFIYSLV